MKRWWISGGVVIVSSTVLELMYRHGAHVEFWWHQTPVFDFLYGLGGCVAIVLVSKWLGRVGLQRGENYYHPDDAN